MSTVHRWEVTFRPGQPTVVLPIPFDGYGLVEVSRIGEQYARFIRTDNGEDIDCAKYAAEMQKDLLR